jgi:succinyl-CoA synthetase alpha subunit
VQAENKAPSAKTLDVKYEAQPNFYYCGPAATRIALTGQGQTPSQDDVAKQLGTTTDGTNSAEDTTRVLNADTKTDVYKTKSIPGPKASPEEADRLRADVKNAVDTGRPVVANIAGTVTDVDGNAHSFGGGHYLTIVGYENDGQTVKIADPANVNGQNAYSVATTDMANWIATRGYSA